MTRDDRTETVTIGGKTRVVTIPRPAPRPPADWDRARSVAATVGTVLVVVGALAWSVYAIGDLLSGVAPAPLAYGVAAVFDLAWILCMAAEYEQRHQPGRQHAPRVLGWVLLATSITAVFLHGLRVADVAVAVAGSAVAVLAKCLWHVRVHINRRALNPAAQAWVEAELDEAGAALAVMSVRRQVNRARARVAAELAAIDAAQPGPLVRGEPAPALPGAPPAVPAPSHQVQAEVAGTGAPVQPPPVPPAESPVPFPAELGSAQAAPPAAPNLHLVQGNAAPGVQPPTPGRTGRDMLAELLEAALADGERALVSNAALARELHRQAGLSEATARRYISEMRSAQ